MIDGEWVWCKGEIAKRGDAMWIKTDARYASFAQVNKFDTIYVAHVASGNWKVCGTIGDRDILIKMGIGNEASATEFAESLINSVS